MDTDGDGALAVEELEHALADPTTRGVAVALLASHATALALDGMDYYQFQQFWASAGADSNAPEQ